MSQLIIYETGVEIDQFLRLSCIMEPCFNQNKTNLDYLNRFSHSPALHSPSPRREGGFLRHQRISRSGHDSVTDVNPGDSRHGVHHVDSESDETWQTTQKKFRAETPINFYLLVDVMDGTAQPRGAVRNLRRAGVYATICGFLFGPI